ncbi:MAG: energy transducer TonB [Hyphomicrobiaceae bacterium]
MLRTGAILASTLLHGALALALVDFSGGRSLDVGSGNDEFVIEQGIAIEGLARFGDAVETVQALDAETVKAQDALPEIAEIKTAEPPPDEPPPLETLPPATEPDELKDVIASPDGPTEQIVTAAAPPPEVFETPQPPQKAQEQIVEQIAVVEQQAAAKAETGGDASAYSAYLGSLSKHVQRFKVRPRNVKVGKVLVRFSIGPDGALISREIERSSGSEELDLAALSAIEKAAPFPRFPASLTRSSIDLTVPFEFVKR